MCAGYCLYFLINKFLVVARSVVCGHLDSTTANVSLRTHIYMVWMWYGQKMVEWPQADQRSQSSDRTRAPMISNVCAVCVYKYMLYHHTSYVYGSHILVRIARNVATRILVYHTHLSPCMDDSRLGKNVLLASIYLNPWHACTFLCNVQSWRSDGVRACRLYFHSLYANANHSPARLCASAG